MYKKDLDILIKSNSLPSSLLLYGDEYSTQKYARFLAKKVSNKEERVTLYYDEYDFGVAKEYISQASLFGDKKLLYIRNDKKIAKKELDKLIEICSKDKCSFFIYHFCGDDRVAKDLSRSFIKKRDADFVRFFKPTFSEAISILNRQAQKIGLDIDPYALSHLYSLENENLLLAENELDKLLLLNKKVNANDVDNYIYALGEINLDKFIQKLLNKEDIRDELFMLLVNEGLDELKIISSISNYINILLLFRIYITAHGTYNVIDILGYPLPAHLAKIRANQSSKITLKSFQAILSHLLDTQYILKSAHKTDKETFLISSLIKLQTYL